MFDSLSEKLGGILDRLTRRGALSEADVDAALREVRRALLEADVALDVARAFTDGVKKQAVGIEVMKSVTPGQMVVKIVHDQLVATLGGDGQGGNQGIDLNAAPPIAIMMVGLQGSGKTTTTAKLARRLTERQRRKVLMASLDVRRPAAMEQLAVLGRDAQIDTLPVVQGQMPPQIARRAIEAAKLGGYDVVLLDTAGRTTLNEEMMNEAAQVKQAANPHEVLLVADLLTGQDAINLARSFDERVGLSGIVLTRVDGDGRGGAALSMRAVTGKPIKLIGTGEKIDALEEFDPSRIAGRILGMGDIVALVEKAAANIDAEKAMRAAEKMRKGAFDLADLREQLTQMQAMGGLGGLMGMLPGIAKMKNQFATANLDENVIKRQIAIIDSMTPKERRNPDILKASRKKRIASGSGTSPEAINKLLKMHRGMSDMMKAMGGAKRGPLAGLAQAMGFGSGMPSPEQMAEMAKKMPGGQLPPNAPGLPPNMPRSAWLAGHVTEPGWKVSWIAGWPAARSGEKEVKTSLSLVSPGRAEGAGPNPPPPFSFFFFPVPPLPAPPGGGVSIEPTKGKLNVSRYPPGPRRYQETAGLSHCRRRQPRAARWPLHRAARLLQSAAAEGKDRAAQTRSRKGTGLDEEGRAAVRPRHALS